MGHPPAGRFRDPYAHTWLVGDESPLQPFNGSPLSRWTQRCACRFALYWLRAATRASPAASTTSVDDARTATRRPGSSTSSSTSPTASLPGPTEYARNATTRASTPVACEIEWHTASMRPVPEPSACTCSSARESFTLARGPSRVPPEYVMSSSCQPVDGSVMRCPLMSSEARVGTVLETIIAPGSLSRSVKDQVEPGRTRQGCASVKIANPQIANPLVPGHGREPDGRTTGRASPGPAL